MAHWANIEDGIVTQVTVGNDNDPDEGHAWLVENLGGVWLKCSYNTRGGVHYTDGEPSADQSKALRGNFPAKGYLYREDLDAFIRPAPYESWILNEETFGWEAPTPKPETGDWEWDETAVAWVEVTVE